MRCWCAAPASAPFAPAATSARSTRPGAGISGDRRSDLGLLPRGIPADPAHPPFSEAVSRDHRRHHDGRRRRGFGQRRLSHRHRAHDVRDAGDRDRPVSRCRRDPLPQSVPGPYRPLSRADRGAARAGRRALLRFRDAFRAARADPGTDRGAGRARPGAPARSGSRSTTVLGRLSPPIRATPPWKARVPAIDRCFAGDRVEAILDALGPERRRRPESEWASGDSRRAAVASRRPASR